MLTNLLSSTEGPGLLSSFELAKTLAARPSSKFPFSNVSFIWSLFPSQGTAETVDVYSLMWKRLGQGEKIDGRPLSRTFVL